MTHQITGFEQDIELSLRGVLICGGHLLPPLFPTPSEPTVLPFLPQLWSYVQYLNSTIYLAGAHVAEDKGPGSLPSPFVRLRCATTVLSQHYLDVLCSFRTLGSVLDSHSNKDPHNFQ